MPEHHRDDEIIVRRTIGLGREGETARPVLLGEGDGDHPGQNNEKRKEHLRDGGDEWCAAGSGHRFRGHRPLHDEKIRAPVTE